MGDAAVFGTVEKPENPSRQAERQAACKAGRGRKNIEITDKNIKSFERIARKYGIDFALKKDPAEGKYYVFFKARDEDVLKTAFAEFTAKSLNRGKKKPSLLAKLAHFKEVAKAYTRNIEKHRYKGEHEL